jgi:hypothetical protein
MERVFVVTHGEGLADLLQQGDQVAGLLDMMTETGQLEPGFLPTTFFPGPSRAEANQEAWRAFWSPRRVAAFSRHLQAAGAPLGFAPEAFTPFLEILTAGHIQPVPPDPAYFELLAIVPDTDGTGWRQFFTLKPGPRYDAAAFYDRLAHTGAARLFDPVFFADRLGHFLAVTFRHMLLVVGASAVVLLGLFFWDLTLTAMALLPLVAAFAGTLGVLGLAGRPLDIPALMLAIIVLGMGIDYALFTIRAFQRYGSETDPELALFRTTVFLAAASTLVGFGALMSADHAVFKSAGLTSFCGILFSAVGTFVFLPPLLRRLFGPTGKREARVAGGSESVFRAARRRFRHLELRPRLVAWRRLRLGGVLRQCPLPDTGDGPVALFPLNYGVEAAWLAETLPGRSLMGADPEDDNIRLATRVTGADADFRIGGIESLAADGRPAALMVLTGRLPEPRDTSRLLEVADRCLTPGGRMIVLAGKPSKRPAWFRLLNRLTRLEPDPYDRGGIDVFLEKQDYGRIEHRPAGDDPGMIWITGVKS